MFFPGSSIQFVADNRTLVRLRLTSLGDIRNTSVRNWLGVTLARLLPSPSFARTTIPLSGRDLLAHDPAYIECGNFSHLLTVAVLNGHKCGACRPAAAPAGSRAPQPASALGNALPIRSVRPPPSRKSPRGLRSPPRAR